MSIPPLHSSNQVYWVNTPKNTPVSADKEASIEDNRLTMPSQEEVVKKGLSTEEHTEMEQAEESSAKSFAYGFLGFDKPSNIEEVEVEEEKTEADDAYFAGRVTKGLGTLGTIIAILI
ncbi:hypothetical protein [Marinomonas colpomeniae]|uniref:Uncharacterized protein n=1 Tax=Marinomonas colpomeniae TaxID=2774408 RepID=A0ABR8NWX1_9GAMM|nr:hypothetical protein [Marinomonas colpomeniae]MBD5770110.1 hypothetical protein [Marinomonas colpomeniae]